MAARPLQRVLALIAVGAGKIGSATPSTTLAFAAASRCASISLMISIERSIYSSVIALMPPLGSTFISRDTRSAQTFKYAAGCCLRTFAMASGQDPSLPEIVSDQISGDGVWMNFRFSRVPPCRCVRVIPA